MSTQMTRNIPFQLLIHLLREGLPRWLKVPLKDEGTPVCGFEYTDFISLLQIGWLGPILLSAVSNYPPTTSTLVPVKRLGLTP